MTYDELKSGLCQYGILYDQGLKKNANILMNSLCTSIGLLTEEERNPVLERLLRDLCDGDELAFLFERGDGEIPYSLRQALYGWLYSRSDQGMIPEMRWFYQVFQYDPVHMQEAGAFLRRAYDLIKEVLVTSNGQKDETIMTYIEIDEKTPELIFELNINSLAYGLHELPSGMLISHEECRETLEECEEILGRFNIRQDLSERLTVLKEVYSSYCG